MLRGILLGSAWGLVLGGGFLALISLTYPATVQPPPETGADVTPDVTAEGPADDTETPSPRLPAPLTEPARHDAAQITRPGETGARPAQADLNPGTAPELTAPVAELGQGPDSAPSAELTAPAPDTAVLPSPQSMPPNAPQPEPEPEIATAPPAPPRAEPGEEITGFPMGDLSEAIESPAQDPADLTVASDTETTAASPDPSDTITTQPDVPATDAEDSSQDPEGTSQIAGLPEETAPAPSDQAPAPVEPESAPEDPVATAPEVTPTPVPLQDDSETAPPATPPTVAMPGAPAIRLTEDPAPVDTADADAPAPEPDAPVAAIDRYAEPFENPEVKPVLSIVLLDSVEAGATEDIPSRFPYPISIAVPVDAPDAAERMTRYRAAGYEVLALASLPAGATPSDVETLSAAWEQAVPEAVAVVEAPPNSLQSSRANGEQLAEVLSDRGLGLLLFADGLDTTRKLASRRGIPAATVFRDLDSAGQSEAVVRRFLDNSAFRASTENAVILIARAREETLQALLVWGLADRASRVALAPVSVALKATAP